MFADAKLFIPADFAPIFSATNSNRDESILLTHLLS